MQNGAVYTQKLKNARYFNTKAPANVGTRIMSTVMCVSLRRWHVGVVQALDSEGVAGSNPMMGSNTPHPPHPSPPSLSA